MAKKLKKKIEDICGLADLDWEARQERANTILNNMEWKQALCNDTQGLCFRDLERVLKSIANERQVRNDDESSKSKPNTSNKSSGSSRPPPRTLEQILAQVYAPRVVPGPMEADAARQDSHRTRKDLLLHSRYDDDEAE